MSQIINSDKSDALALESLFSYAPLGLAFFDRDGRYTRVNEYMAQINKRSTDDHIGRKISEIHPLTANALFASILCVFDRGVPLPIQPCVIDTCDEDQKHKAVFSFFPVFDEDDDIVEVGTAMFLQDTALPRDGIRTPHELKFRHLAESLPSIVWTSDPEGQINYISPQWSEYSGVSMDDYEAYTDMDSFVHESDRAQAVSMWKQTIEKGDIYDYSYRLKDANSQYRYHRARAVPIRDHEGKITSWYGTLTDIEDLKRAEISLQEATEEKDMFIAELSHELRNPLLAISATYEIIRHPKAEEDERNSALLQLGEQIEHVRKLVDNTLDISRLTSDKLRVEKVPTEVNQLVRTAAAGVDEIAKGRGITFELNLHDQPLWVDVDSVRIVQCIGNLLTNATKFTEAGGKVTLSVCPVDEEKNVLIRVKDTGIGMDKQEITKLFKPFAQSSKNEQRPQNKGGLGLGLAVVAKLIELHSGTVSASSDGLGTGTTFSLKLPCTESPDEEAAVPEENSHISLDPADILLIEDNQSVAASLKFFFELEGHTVQHTAHVMEALEMVEQSKPDIVFCDHALGGDQNSLDFLRMLQGKFDGKIPSYLVALSGHSDPSHVEECLAAGFDEFLAKPPELDALRQSICKSLYKE
ncbi:ATP-binding protein [Rubritalea spongiae]|uniref:histidine kinase n=1 Tax=Rubritalea spongiae TaxID=430797 RepID=A0ABW5DXN2_9BACT